MPWVMALLLQEGPLLPWDIAVSYTHLDVYKRQGVLLSLGIYAQVPQGFNYQAVVRNDQGTPLSGQQVSIRISLQDEAGVITHYSETHSVTTSPQGVVSFVVGSGTVQNGTFANIPWAEGNKMCIRDSQYQWTEHYCHRGEGRIYEYRFSEYFYRYFGRREQYHWFW